MCASDTFKNSTPFYVIFLHGGFCRILLIVPVLILEPKAWNWGERKVWAETIHQIDLPIKVQANLPITVVNRTIILQGRFYKVCKKQEVVCTAGSTYNLLLLRRRSTRGLYGVCTVKLKLANFPITILAYS